MMQTVWAGGGGRNVFFFLGGGIRKLLRSTALRQQLACHTPLYKGTSHESVLSPFLLTHRHTALTASPVHWWHDCDGSDQQQWDRITGGVPPGPAPGAATTDSWVHMPQKASPRLSTPQHWPKKQTLLQKHHTRAERPAGPLNSEKL